MQWESWLAKNGTSSLGIWLKFAKKSSGVPSVTKPDAIEAAIANGWIDGQLNPFNEHFWLVRFTGRGPNSKWSQVNVATASRLESEGKLTAAGQTEVDRARSDGRWQAAYPSASNADVPDDLSEALEAEPGAKAFFVTLTGANRYSVLYRIHNTKTAKARAATISKFVAMLAAGKTVYPAKA